MGSAFSQNSRITKKSVCCRLTGTSLLQSPQGETCASTAEAFDMEMARRGNSTADPAATLTFIQRFLKDCAMESGTTKTQVVLPSDGLSNAGVPGQQPEPGQEGIATDAENVSRVVVTTSSLEDWLWRGDDPIVKDMSWEVYAMWMYRIEKLPRATSDEDSKQPRQRFIDVEFSSDYKMHHSHCQRLATEFRVPLFEGFTMPPSSRDSETAALYKLLLLKPLAVPLNECPEDQRLVQAFAPTCNAEAAGDEDHNTRAVQAFYWTNRQNGMGRKGREGKKRERNGTGRNGKSEGLRDWPKTLPILEG